MSKQKNKIEKKIIRYDLEDDVVGFCRQRLDLMRPTYDGDFLSGPGSGAEAKEDALFENLAAAQHASSRLMLANCLMPSRFVILGPRTTSPPPPDARVIAEINSSFFRFILFPLFFVSQYPAWCQHHLPKLCYYVIFFNKFSLFTGFNF